MKEITLKARAKLNISLDGYKAGDYTMIIGYPGSTNRYSSSFEVNFDETLQLPITNRLRGAQMDIIKRWMDADPEIRLKYSDYYFSLSNVQELYSGQVECVDRFDVVEQKEIIEKELQEWIDADPERKARWGKLLHELKTKYIAVEGPERDVNYFRETIVRGTLISRLNYRINSFKKDGIQTINERMLKEYDNFDLKVEKDLFRYAVEEFYLNVSWEMMSDYHKDLYDRHSGDYDNITAEVWDGSFMTDITRRDSFFAAGHPYEDYISDPLYRFFQTMKVVSFNDRIIAAQGDVRITDTDREFAHALYQMRLDKGIAQYPDANSTMRITYGTVGGIEPKDGVVCDWKTTPAGILEKYNPSDYDFTLNDRQYLLYRSAEWGRWGSGEENSVMYVNFLTDNDITGGNSGSPVLNAHGELIGLAFDGNKESLASDVFYTPGYNKCVCVDIRFVLWTLDRYAGMTHIIEEIGL